jgi:hypothetical protein
VELLFFGWDIFVTRNNDNAIKHKSTQFFIYIFDEEETILFNLQFYIFCLFVIQTHL